MSGFFVVEILDAAGRVVRCDRITRRDGQGAVTIGRSIEEDIIIDDPYVAARHAMVSFDGGGRVAITDCGSINGIVVNGKRLHGISQVPVSGETILIGRTRLRLRSNDDGMAAEKRDAFGTFDAFGDSFGVAAASLGVGLVQLFYSAWLDAPQDLAASFVWLAAGATVIVALWVGFWALLSRVSQGEWRWLRHSAIFLTAGVLSEVAAGAADWVRFAFSLPHISGESFWFGLATLCGLLYFHLRATSGLSRRRVAIFAVALPVLLGVGQVWLSGRRSYLAVNEIAEAPAIYPSAFRLSASRGLDSYFADAGRLKAEAEAKRAKADALNPDVVEP